MLQSLHQVRAEDLEQYHHQQIKISIPCRTPEWSYFPWSPFPVVDYYGEIYYVAQQRQISVLVVGHNDEHAQEIGLPKSRTGRVDSRQLNKHEYFSSSTLIVENLYAITPRSTRNTQTDISHQSLLTFVGLTIRNYA
jgi:hypothetical protein